MSLPGNAVLLFYHAVLMRSDVPDRRGVAEAPVAVVKRLLPHLRLVELETLHGSPLQVHRLAAEYVINGSSEQCDERLLVAVQVCRIPCQMRACPASPPPCTIKTARGSKLSEHLHSVQTTFCLRISGSPQQSQGCGT